MQTMRKICPCCNKEFTATLAGHGLSGFATFCSLSCAAKFNHSKKPKPLPNCICAQCNKEFYRPLSKLKNATHGIRFCSRACKDKAQRLGGITEIMPDHYGSNNSVASYRERAFRELPRLCNRCGYNTNEHALVVHHKDADRTNNHIDNLELICANCHAIEHWGE